MTTSIPAAGDSAGTQPETGAEPDGEPVHLLVVDDDSRLRSVLHRYLLKSGFRVTEAGDAGEARARLQSFAFDLIILDVMMPGESGVELLSDIRRTNRVPILLLTAMAEGPDRIAGLESGADDYVVKPFEPRELVLRIRNILNRVPASTPELPRLLRLGTCRFDLVRGELMRAGAPVHLTSGEAALLSALARRAGEAVSREDLSEYGQVSGGVRTVDVQMTRLRRKIERDPKFPRYLQTVRGTGYVLKPD